MSRLTRVALVAGIALLGGCSTLMGPKGPTGEQIDISVGPCFGFCPVYNVTMAPDGTVIFEGVRHTEVIGERQTTSEAGVQRIATALARYRPDSGTTDVTECDDQISDMQHYVIVWTDASGRKTTLNHDRGCMSRANQRLNVALETLPDVLGIRDWAKQVTRPGASRG